MSNDECQDLLARVSVFNESEERLEEREALRSSFGATRSGCTARPLGTQEYWLAWLRWYEHNC